MFGTRTLCRRPTHRTVLLWSSGGCKLAACTTGRPHATGCLTHVSHHLVETLDQRVASRSEEHTSELQSLTNLVCRLLLEKKKKPTKMRKTVLRVATSKKHTLTVSPRISQAI